jgi:hypothetical protein
MHHRSTLKRQHKALIGICVHTPDEGSVYTHSSTLQRVKLGQTGRFYSFGTHVSAQITPDCS